jgi:hypothetical protein
MLVLIQPEKERDNMGIWNMKVVGRLLACLDARDARGGLRMLYRGSTEGVPAERDDCLW